MNKYLIETKSLKKYFQTSHGLLHAVDDINFGISEGKTLGVVGESGCGKSTLGRVILQLIPATAGEVLYKGENVLNYGKKKLDRIRHEMQIIFQDPYSSLNPRMTVFELIADPLIANKSNIRKAEMSECVFELMERVGLSQKLVNTYPHELDGGRRQRIGIARALTLKPKFIVCDEPVSALDVSVQAQILNLLMDLQDSMGLTYMFITHDLSVVRHISDEIAVLYLGKCVEKAPKRELFSNPIHPYTKALLSAIMLPSIETRNATIKLIRGEVTSPINPRPGCRFAPRCEFSTSRCLEKDIELKEVEQNHFVACALQD
jgi:peptide/nickel transport system ATP-binding protein